MREVRDCVIPGVFVWRLLIKDRGVPLNIQSPYRFGKGALLSISVGPNLDLRKVMPDCEEVDITINFLNALLSVYLEGAIMHFIFEPFKLTTGVDSLALASISVLMHNGNDWAML